LYILITFTMKRIGSILLFILFAIAWQPSAAQPFLEIHHIGCGDGDATLLLAVDSTGTNLFTGQPIWDTCTVLIDGQREGAGPEVWRYVRDTITARFPTRKILDFIVVSHLHIDHYGGLTDLITDAVAARWRITGVVTRSVLNTATITNSGGEIDTCYSDIQLNVSWGAKKNAFFQAITDNNIAQPALIVGGNLFHYKGFKNISMECIVTVGATYNSAGDGNLIFIPETYSGSGFYKAKSENDLSYGWLLSFQGFHYTSYGDLGGVNSSRYVDGETPVTNYLVHRFDDDDYHICVHKVSHHGSAESSTKQFAAANNIFLAVFTASLRAYGRSTKPLPTETAIKNLLSNPKTTQLLFTFVPMNPGIPASYWKFQNLQYYNDVIVKVNGGPGYPDNGENLPFTVVQSQKNLDYSYTGVVTVTTYNCTKGHNWSLGDDKMDTNNKKRKLTK